jgi:hypothetical protein
VEVPRLLLPPGLAELHPLHHHHHQWEESNVSIVHNNIIIVCMLSVKESMGEYNKLIL